MIVSTVFSVVHGQYTFQGSKTWCGRRSAAQMNVQLARPLGKTAIFPAAPPSFC